MRSFDNLRIFLRQGNIVFSRRFIDVLRSKRVILTRRDRFKRNGIMINHGNTKSYSLSPNVNQFYCLNKPDAIHYCCNKIQNYDILKDYYPESYSHYSKVDEFPVLAKPYGGHHGYGITKLDTERALRKFFNRTSKRYIIQKFIPIKHEFRFNVLDRSVFQVSRKIRQDGNTPKGGYIFEYVSLGSDAKISDKFWNFIKDVIGTFHKKVGYDLAHYGIDVMKGKDGVYYLSEINSACGIGEFTIDKLLDVIEIKYNAGTLESYRVE